MKRTVDPVWERLSAERRSAQTWLAVLCKGVGHCLTECSEAYPEDLATVLDVSDNYLRAAIAAAKKSDESYAPYWRRRRLRYIRNSKVKKAKAV